MELKMIEGRLYKLVVCEYIVVNGERVYATHGKFPCLDACNTLTRRGCFAPFLSLLPFLIIFFFLLRFWITLNCLLQYIIKVALNYCLFWFCHVANFTGVLGFAEIVLFLLKVGSISWIRQDKPTLNWDPRTDTTGVSSLSNVPKYFTLSTVFIKDFLTVQ